MLKFIKHHMTSIEGIETYPIISLIIFVLFFALLGFFVLKTSKSYIHMMSHMPLDDEQGSDNHALNP